MQYKFQETLFEKIRKKLGTNQSLVDHLTDILNMSTDSGYRRIRGETSLTFDEAAALAEHFRISLDEILGNGNESAVFRRLPFINSLDTYKNYMQASLEQLEMIKKKKNHLMIYSAKDIPIFYQFAFPKLAAFKMYVWWKSVYNLEKIDGQYYSLGDIPQEMLDLAAKQWAAFSQINTIEIWNDTTILSMINQISYFYEAGLLRDREEALDLCEEFRNMIKIIYRQAITGNKVHANNPEVESGAYCKIYYHEILIMDNHILAELQDDNCYYFIPYGGLNFLTTTDSEITTNVREYLRGQIKKAALISDASEKDRNRFFIRIRNKIDVLKEKIKTTDPLL